ncbi:hypothetical protein BCE_1041 [Bacillus cereus ATCC 10987]|uniref:Uncharacterized protein n=1 Tax=Bacillus cereus (strain ATCC 10987 / NRS 248) TaxID=222523 RepID=Q73CM4_BACC1|nr:hypothetical protein BCE_1041 [Bacillus cereus ATCC 10987]
MGQKAPQGVFFLFSKGPAHIQASNIKYIESVKTHE